jgi:K+-sensing histidine kinase KdpD
MLGSCAELVEFRTDIIRVRSDLQANTQALAQLSATVAELERRQADAESAARQAQQDLSQAIEVLLRKALITEDHQITRESARSQLRDSEMQEPQARYPASAGQRTSSRGENSLQGKKPLSLGMTQDDVRGMLGEPFSIEPVGPYVFWHYAPMSNQQYVIFDKRSGQVSGWRGR